MSHSLYRPHVTFHRAKQSYFLHANYAYPVADATTETFREAVLLLAPHWISSEVYGPLVANPDDLADRWFLLCGLCELGRAMKLYDSPEQALAVVIPSGLSW